MQHLQLYSAISRFGRLNYRAKIMVVAFLGTHVPLLAIVGFYLFRTTSDMAIIWSTLGVALAATLIGTGITLFVLNQLLQPVLLTSRALRDYRRSREIAPLPTGFTDEAGTLMADASQTLHQLEASLRTLETTDAVTGLPNRASFVALLDNVVANEARNAIAVVSVPNMAQLIAAYDQATGDAFARSLASRLASGFGSTVPFARVDGGMFAALLAEGNKADTASAVASRVQAVIAAAAADVTLGEVVVHPELMVGVALAGDGETGEALLANAVAASARNQMPGSVSFHSPVARDAARQSFEMEQELRQAIRAEQFELHFQPVVDLAKGRATGAEALIRWQHPDRGMIAPGLFIPTAERSGLIDDIGRFVIRRACQQVGSWQTGSMSGLKVAINLSARQFLDPQLVGLLSESITDAGIDASRLEIELTESAAMADYEHTRRAFEKLSDLGVSIAIDDFGTGYASMSYLRKLPFDKLKIDREFVTNIDTNAPNQAICNAMVALSKGLGLRVLAEGVERPDEVSYLRSAGCDLFQGFYFARPVAAERMEETLADIDMQIIAREPLAADMPAARVA